MTRLAGKVCVVTGASGMGADAARRFAAEGAAVTVLAKDEGQCAALDLPYSSSNHRRSRDGRGLRTGLRAARQDRRDVRGCRRDGRKIGDGPVTRDVARRLAGTLTACRPFVPHRPRSRTSHAESTNERH